MRKDGTIGEKNAEDDAKVWEIVAHIRRIKNSNNPDEGIIKVLIEDLKNKYNFKWDLDKDQGTYSGSKVWYNGDRKQVDKQGAEVVVDNNVKGDGIITTSVGAIDLNNFDGLTPKQIKEMVEHYKRNPHTQKPTAKGSTVDTSGVNTTGNNTDDNPKYAGFKNRTSAFAFYEELFTDLGLPNGFFNKEIKNLIRKAPTKRAALLGLRETDEWKTRFAGNEQRVKNGLQPISEAEYIADERAFHSVMRENGLPQHFYDSPEDYANFIGSNISPEQINKRAQIAGDLLATKNNPALWAELKSRGISKGDATAYILDPDKAMPQIERKIGSAEIGAAMKPAGLDLGGKKKSNKFENSLYDKGITEEQAKEAALDVADEDKDWSMLAGRDVNDKIQVKDKLGIGGKKVKKWKDEKKHLASEERARFNEKGGGGSMFGNYNL